MKMEANKHRWTPPSYNVTTDHHRISSSHTAVAKGRISRFREMQMEANKAETKENGSKHKMNQKANAKW